MNADDYRAKAEEMRALARTAPDVLLKAEYLKLAQSWEELLRTAAETEAKRKDH